MKLNPPNAHRSQIKICEKRQTRNVQFRFMTNTFRILKPIQKSSKCVWVFHNTGANAVDKNQMRLAYEDKRDLYCRFDSMVFIQLDFVYFVGVWMISRHLANFWFPKIWAMNIEHATLLIVCIFNSMGTLPMFKFKFIFTFYYIILNIHINIR